MCVFLYSSSVGEIERARESTIEFMETTEHILSMSMSNSVEGVEYGFRIQAHIIS